MMVTCRSNRQIKGEKISPFFLAFLPDENVKLISLYFLYIIILSFFFFWLNFKNKIDIIDSKLIISNLHDIKPTPN